jgi:hypothetical protein
VFTVTSMAFTSAFVFLGTVSVDTVANHKAGFLHAD